MADEMELDSCREGDSDLPEGWALATVGDILTINYGKGLIEAKRRGGHVAVYGSAGIVGYHDEPLTGGPTIVIGRKGTVGAVSYSVSPCWPIDTAYFVEEFFGLDPEYLFHALGSLGLGELDTSTAVPGLNRDDAYRQQLPVPPLAEQKRIVAKVEELLVQVNAARDRLAKVQAVLKRLRQSVLAAACSGRLTADWRENHPEVEPASELLKRILAERCATMAEKHREPMNVPSPDDADVPETWQWVSSDAVFTFVTSGSRGWARYYSDHGAVFLRVGNLDHHSITLDMQNVQHVTPPEGQEAVRTRVRPGDVLISVTAEVGMVALVPDGISQAHVNQHVSIARPVAAIKKEFLAWYLASPSGGQRQFEELQRGATKAGLGLDDIRSVAVPLPPLPEQEEIVRRVEALFALVDGIEKSRRAATLRTEKLTQAILAKAFRGELVPTEAELARNEGRDYEPASVLLARIRQERAEQETSKAKRGRQ